LTNLNFFSIKLGLKKEKHTWLTHHAYKQATKQLQEVRAGATKE